MAVIVSATPEHFGFTSGHYDDLTKMANDIEKEANKKDATFIDVMGLAIKSCREFKDRISCILHCCCNVGLYLRHQEGTELLHQTFLC